RKRSGIALFPSCIRFFVSRVEGNKEESMATLREWMRRLWGTLRRNRREVEMEEELRSHLELAADEMRRRGAKEDAIRMARLQVGGVAQAMEAMRDQRGLPWLEDLTRDLRHALRSLRRAPALTSTVVVTLALGIGANAAIFSVVRSVLLRPLVNRDADRLIYIRQTAQGIGTENLTFSVPEINDL